MQPQLGQVSFSLEIEVFVSNIFGLVVIMIMNLTIIINNIAYKINPSSGFCPFLKKINNYILKMIIIIVR